MLSLPINEIHLWFAFPQQISEPKLLNEYAQLLNPEEKQRWQQFRFPKHQHQYLITRALVRTTLANYANLQPQKLQFSANKYGKPKLKHVSTPLFFNLSNTDTLIVCAISQQQQIGVDVESIQHKTSSVDIAHRFFAAQEYQDLIALPQQDQRQRFFQFWTLKEAFIKAKGMGLSLPLDKFAFSIMPKTKLLTLKMHVQLEEIASNWSCWLLQPNTEHYTSVCVFNPNNLSYTLNMNQVVPLQTTQPMSSELLATTILVTT